jgi:hypothetical protein
MIPRPHPDEDPCPWCGDELQDGCCDHCDDRYAANDNQEAA